MQLTNHSLQTQLFSHLQLSHRLLETELKEVEVVDQKGLVDTLNLFSPQHHILSLLAALRKDFEHEGSTVGVIVTLNADCHERARFSIADTKSYVPVTVAGDQPRWVDVSQRVEAEVSVENMRDGKIVTPAYITVSFNGKPINNISGFSKTRHYQEEAPVHQFDGMTNRKLKNLANDISDFLSKGTFPIEEKF